MVELEAGLRWRRPPDVEFEAGCISRPLSSAELVGWSRTGDTTLGEPAGSLRTAFLALSPAGRAHSIVIQPSFQSEEYACAAGCDKICSVGRRGRRSTGNGGDEGVELGGVGGRAVSRKTSSPWSFGRRSAVRSSVYWSVGPLLCFGGVLGLT